MPNNIRHNACVAATVLAILMAVVVIDVRDAAAERPMALAHYMPWFIADPAGDRWGYHWTMNHFDPSRVDADGRRQIASRDDPLIGPYDSADAKVLEYHLLTMKAAGIDGVIVDWYGLTDLYDYAELHHRTRQLVMQVERLKMRFAICYEDQTIAALVREGRIETKDMARHAAEEIAWLRNDWFRSEAYVKVDGRPLLLSFGNEGLSGEQWTEVLRPIADSVCYLSEHTRRDLAAGGFDWPIPSLGLDQINRFAEVSQAWPLRMPAIYPGFDDVYGEAGVRTSYPVIPRENGSTLVRTIREAAAMRPKIVQLVTWNDWGEGTQIEPSFQHGFRSLQIIQKAFAPDHNADALRLPLRLYRLRVRDDAVGDRLDEIADDLADRRYADAESKLSRYETERGIVNTVEAD